VDKAKEELRVYSEVRFGCDADDLDLIPPKKGPVLHNPHLAGASSPKNRISTVSGVTAKIGESLGTSRNSLISSHDVSLDEEDVCPQLMFPNFIARSALISQRRWLRWASDLACIFETIMMGVKEPNVEAKEEHIAKVWAENQWDHWQCSSDPIIVHNSPQVAHGDRVSAVKAALKDLERKSLAGVKNMAVATSHDLEGGKAAGRQCCLASRERLRHYNELLKRIRHEGVCFDESGRPPDPPAAPPKIQYPRIIQSPISSIENRRRLGDGTLELDSTQAGIARNAVASAPFAFRRGGAVNF